jgi:hypothetical protein
MADAHYGQINPKLPWLGNFLTKIHSAFQQLDGSNHRVFEERVISMGKRARDQFCRDQKATLNSAGPSFARLREVI